MLDSLFSYDGLWFSSPHFFPTSWICALRSERCMFLLLGCGLYFHELPGQPAHHTSRGPDRPIHASAVSDRRIAPQDRWWVAGSVVTERHHYTQASSPKRMQTWKPAPSHTGWNPRPCCACHGRSDLLGVTSVLVISATKLHHLSRSYALINLLFPWAEYMQISTTITRLPRIGVIVCSDFGSLRNAIG